MAGRILTATLYAIGVALFYLGAAKLVRYFGRKHAKVLLYHDCAELETSYTAGLDCTTPPSAFAKHLDYLKQYHRVVTLDSIATGTAPPSSVAITFDDGYRSVFENAFPLLSDRQLSATMYLISDVVGNEDMVWVNELNHWLRTEPETTYALVREFFEAVPEGPAPEVISHCRLNYGAKLMAALLGELRVALGYSVSEHARAAQLYVNWDQIEGMSDNGFTFGNHTQTHPNLERLSEEEQRAEIRGAQEVLSERISGVRSLAYPFGHHSDESARIAAEVGLESVVEVGGHNLPVDPLAIGRVHLSNQSVAGLFARMQIVEPVKGALRNSLMRRRRRGIGQAGSAATA